MCGTCEGLVEFDVGRVISPSGRPYLQGMSGRLLRPLLFFGFVIVIGLLSLADRAPDLVKSEWSVVQRIGSIGERLVGLDIIDRGDIPLAFDTVGHLALWGIAGVLAYIAFGRRTSPWFLMISLITLSAGVELGQGFLSATRRPQVTDLIANSIGVAVGVALAAVVWSTISVFGRLTRTLTR